LTQENPLLYRRFLASVQKLHPDLQIDPDVIDKMLEYDEAFNELKQYYPDLEMTGQAKSQLQNSRNHEGQLAFNWQLREALH